MHLGLLFLMLSTSFVSGTFSQNLNKNALKSQCDFQHVLKTKFTISDYENNIRKFKYIYSFDKELDEDQGVTLYIDNKTCLFLTNKYKKIGFKDNEDEYYKLKNIIVSTNVFTGSLEDCLQLEDIDTLYQEACIIHKEITTQRKQQQPHHNKEQRQQHNKEQQPHHNKEQRQQHNKEQRQHHNKEQRQHHNKEQRQQKQQPRQQHNKEPR